MNYTGNIIDMSDIPTLQNSEDYFTKFRDKLKEKKLNFDTWQETKANCLCFKDKVIYFQGAGKTHWWAFSYSVIKKIQENGLKPLLVLSGEWGNETKYYKYNGIIEQQNDSSRYMLSGDLNEPWREISNWDTIFEKE